MSFWELVIFVLGLACPRTGILPFFMVNCEFVICPMKMNIYEYEYMKIIYVNCG